MYGKNAFSTKQGKVVVKNKDIFNLLSLEIPAFMDKRSDLMVMVGAQLSERPEVFRYMDADSIQITLTSEGYDSSVWGGRI